MCGIAGFLSNTLWTRAVGTDPDWIDGIARQFADASPDDPAAIDRALDGLAGRFDSLMSFATHLAAIQRPEVRTKLAALGRRCAQLEAALKAGPRAREVAVERCAERLRDYAWQIDTEVLGNIDRTLGLIPAPAAANAAQHFVAWGTGQVLENLDRLEVRGRDSAGITVQLTLDHPISDLELRTLRAELADGRPASPDAHEGVALHELADGRLTARFTYKVSQLIGRLGDNGAALRASIRADGLFWRLAGRVGTMTAMAHTRWASHGAINLINCHPLNASLAADNGPLSVDADTMAALNGDVDNYRALRETVVEAAGHRLAPEVTTDAKIIPVLFRLQNKEASVADRFLATLRRLDGSMAITLVNPGEPGRLHLGQKGSGQSLFVGATNDGLIVASENYGLAPRTRSSIALAQVERGGLLATLSTRPDEPLVSGRTIDDGTPAALKAEPIEIFSRDIFRAGFDHFFEKEVHEAPASVRKTLAGRYLRAGGRVVFDQVDGGPWTSLRHRMTDPDRPRIRRIFTIGQGTAAIAATGVAHLLRQALAGTGILIESAKASELSADLDGADLGDAIVIAISQSGTTTDTNRTVDLARAAGAWIHAIVNRRSSPLVRKSDSHIFTSDGRDIEMAVASTKAFYGQVTAGKLTALCLADTLASLDPARIHDEVVALETLPTRIQEVLDDEGAIEACAAATAPFNRYWAVVGNGPNRVAAEEIRIKLSELCYKSIPVDHTEDKKHIDLSTEPLTLVIANDLPPLLAQDTAKEVAIFKAHNGKPVVFAAKGETGFDSYADHVIRLPSAGAGLDFVLATVAGHLWGFHAARAIDRGSTGFRALGSAMDRALVDLSLPLAPLVERMEEELESIAGGAQDAALPPRLAARLARLAAALGRGPTAAERNRLLAEGIPLMRTLFEESSRPIDTIRHQAKTVTVGISRPGREMASALAGALAELGVAQANLAEHDRQMLIALSPLLSGVPGGMLYDAVGTAPDGLPLLRTAGKIGTSAARRSSYDDAPKVVAGSKRRALRLARAVLSGGPSGAENLILIPVFDEQDWRLTGLALLHVELVAQASLQQKLAVLKDLRLYEDLVDAFHEAGGSAAGLDFGAHAETLSPRDLLFRPAR